MDKEDIKKIVCDVCGIKLSDIKRRTKEQDVVMARHFIAHYMFTYLNYSIRSIAIEVGVNRNSLYKPLFHDTVVSRSRTHALLRERFNKIQEQVDMCDKSCR